jgi:uroporphyrinogen decarboxylase
LASKLLIDVIAGRPHARVPCWFMRQAGRYLPEYQRLRADYPDFLRFCYTPEATVEAALQPLRRFRFDAAILFSDILVVPDALGQSVRFVEGEGPVLAPIRQADQIAGLHPARAEDRLAPVFESVRRLRAALPEDVALIGFAGAPWTLAHYMVEGRGGSDGGTLRRWAWHEADSFSRLIDLLVETVTVYLQHQVEAGADALQLFDSWAGGLAEPQFRRWVIEPTRRIVEGVRSRSPHIPIIGFPRGAGALYADYVKETGVNAVGLDQAVPVGWAARTLQPVCAVQGHLDNQLLVAGGGAMSYEAWRILEAFAGGGHIFNLGHGILPETPVDHVGEVVELVRDWRKG